MKKTKKMIISKISFWFNINNYIYFHLIYIKNVKKTNYNKMKKIITPTNYLY